MLNIESFRSQGLGIIDRVTDIDIVKEDILGHGPELNTNTTLFTLVSKRQLQEYLTYNLIEACYWGKVLEVIWVGNFTRGPLALVSRIIDQRGEPFALEKRVGFVRTAKSIEVNDSSEKANSFTASTRRNQEPRHTWSLEQ